MRRAVICFAALASACVAPAPGELTSDDFRKPAPGSLVRLIKPVAVDGDTLRAGDLEIRLYRVDTPEMFSSARCDDEKAAGRVARAFVQARLDAGARVIAIIAGERDKYGRSLADVEIDGKDLGDTLIEARYARPYQSGWHLWCETPGALSPFSASLPPG